MKLAREMRGWTQVQLAEKIGRSQGTLVSIEKMAQLPIKHVVRFDKIFGGNEWRKPSTVREEPEEYRGLGHDIKELREEIRRLSERVAALESTRRPVRK